MAALAEVWPVAAPERIVVPAGERAARHLIQTAAEDAVAVCDYVLEIEDGARLDFHILNMGGKRGRVSLDVTLAEGAHFELGGALVGTGSKTQAMVATVRHGGPNRKGMEKTST